MSSAAASWVAPTAAQKYGIGSPRQVRKDPSGLDAVHAPSAVAESGHLAPAMLAFGALAAVTVGLAAYSTSVRVGPVSADLKVGK